MIFVIIFIRVHFIASYTFPVPWPDEAAFIWQGKAIQQNYSLFAPELHPYREILWMPPGYMITLGIIFKLVGSSLAVARNVSLIVSIAIFILLSLLWKENNARFFLAVLGGLFFINRFFIILGNTARMEPLLILGVIGSLLLLHKNKTYKALAILLALPLIHPNAFYFLISAIAFIILQSRYFKERGKIIFSDKLLFLLVILLWMAYIFFAALHWNNFINDMSFQFAGKAEGDLFRSFKTPGSMGLFMLLLFGIIYAFVKKDRNLLLLTLYALSFRIVQKIGHEMWYQVYDAFEFLLLSVAFIYYISRLEKRFLRLLLFGLVLIGNYKLGMFEKLGGYPYSIEWEDMRISSSLEYINKIDIDKIKKLILDHKSQDQLLRVKFEPLADALFFEDINGKSIGTIYVHSDTTSIFPYRNHDLYIIHISRHLPKRWSQDPLQWALSNARIDTTDKKFLYYQRDSTEAWYYSSVKNL
jgi:hypothetical protein